MFQLELLAKITEKDDVLQDIYLSKFKQLQMENELRSLLLRLSPSYSGDNSITGMIGGDNIFTAKDTLTERMSFVP